MTLVLLLFLVLLLTITGLLYLSGIRSKRVLVGIPAAFFALPVLLVLGLYLLRAPIQQGKFLPGLGPLFSLAFPADDLYEALAVTEMAPDRTEYVMDLTHKYVGRHAVWITVPGRFGIENLEHDLRITLRIYEGSVLRYETGPDEGGQFWGKDHYGLYFSRYRVPGDAPVAVLLTAKIKLSGDLAGFLEGREGTTLSVSKMSDE